MARSFIFVALAGICGAAMAQQTPAEKMGVRLKVAYFTSSDFELRDGGSDSLKGPQVSLDIPFSKMRDFDLYVTPSVGFGGQLAHGHDIDGTVYRFMLTARKSFGPGGLTGSASIGFGHTESRGTNAFRDGDGVVGEVALGVPLRRIKLLGDVAPGVEFAYSFSGQEQLRGWSLGLTFGF